MAHRTKHDNDRLPMKQIPTRGVRKIWGAPIGTTVKRMNVQPAQGWNRRREEARRRDRF